MKMEKDCEVNRKKAGENNGSKLPAGTAGMKKLVKDISVGFSKSL